MNSKSKQVPDAIVSYSVIKLSSSVVDRVNHKYVYNLLLPVTSVV